MKKYSFLLLILLASCVSKTNQLESKFSEVVPGTSDNFQISRKPKIVIKEIDDPKEMFDDMLLLAPRFEGDNTRFEMVGLTQTGPAELSSEDMRNFAMKKGFLLAIFYIFRDTDDLLQVPNKLELKRSQKKGATATWALFYSKRIKN